MTIKILGYGEVGQSITRYIEQFMGIEIFIEDPKYKLYPPKAKRFDFVLVCIPFSDLFIQTVLKELDKTEKIIIFSTVPIGTTELIPKAIHIPIEGKHPDLIDSFGFWTLFMGHNDPQYLKEYTDFFRDIAKEIIPIKNTRTTEACKLLSTLMYGVNIEFYRYAANLLENHGGNPEIFNQYNEAYNALYHCLGNQNIKRYILDPPKGDIGGHCVVQNAKYLSGIFPDIVKLHFDHIDDECISNL